MSPLSDLSDGAGPPAAAPPSQPAGTAGVQPNPISRLSHRIFLIAAAAAGVVAVVGIAAFTRPHGAQGGAGVQAMGVFLACFAVLKYMVAARAVSTPVNPDGSSTRELYATPGRFRLYVIMKVVGATVALFASIYILRHGAAHLS
jgi:hypothetical protein